MCSLPSLPDNQPNGSEGLVRRERDRLRALLWLITGWHGAEFLRFTKPNRYREHKKKGVEPVNDTNDWISFTNNFIDPCLLCHRDDFGILWFSRSACKYPILHWFLSAMWSCHYVDQLVWLPSLLLQHEHITQPISTYSNILYFKMSCTTRVESVCCVTLKARASHLTHETPAKQRKL